MSPRFWGAGATPRGPALAFIVSPADRTESLGHIRAAGGDEAIHVTGGLSAGSLGWSLSGEVARHRWTVTLYVTACQKARKPVHAGIQDFDYDARVSGLTSGRYRLRVVHLYVNHEGEPLGEAVTVLEQPLIVGRAVINAVLPALCWLGLWTTTLAA